MIVSTEEVVALDREGKRRKHWTLKCDSCRNSFLRPKRLVRSKKHYCSKECRYLGQQNRHQFDCSRCGKQFSRRTSSMKKSRHGVYFCSRRCKDKGQSLENGIKEIWPSHYGSGTGKHDYRERALLAQGKVCGECGYSENIAALQVHHIDGDRENNKEDNLQVLCANYHAIKTWGVS